jgi:hypothetical protein
MDPSFAPRRTPILSWGSQADGTRITGQFAGLRAGKFGPLCDLTTPDGPLTLPAPTVLAERLAQIPAGASIVIVHRGLRSSRTNPARQYRDFEVSIKPDDRLSTRQEPETEAPLEAEAFGAEDVPF